MLILIYSLSEDISYLTKPPGKESLTDVFHWQWAAITSNVLQSLPLSTEQTGHGSHFKQYHNPGEGEAQKGETLKRDIAQGRGE